MLSAACVNEAVFVVVVLFFFFFFFGHTRIWKFLGEGLNASCYSTVVATPDP